MDLDKNVKIYSHDLGHVTLRQSIFVFFNSLCYASEIYRLYRAYHVFAKQFISAGSCVRCLIGIKTLQRTRPLYKTTQSSCAYEEKETNRNRKLIMLLLNEFDFPIVFDKRCLSRDILGSRCARWFVLPPRRSLRGPNRFTCLKGLLSRIRLELYFCHSEKRSCVPFLKFRDNEPRPLSQTLSSPPRRYFSPRNIMNFVARDSAKGCMLYLIRN